VTFGVGFTADVDASAMPRDPFDCAFGVDFDVPAAFCDFFGRCILVDPDGRDGATSPNSSANFCSSGVSDVGGGLVVELDEPVLLRNPNAPGILCAPLG
jgi:hypothetical protein